MITPRATEKAYNAEKQHVYVFYVDKGMSKQTIAKAISTEFKVTVEAVRVLTRKGKATRFSRGKHAYPGTTYREDHKVAYVTVKEGDKIPVFEEPKPAEKADAKAEKTEKSDKAEKKAAKKAEKSEKAATKKVAKKSTNTEEEK